jgi:hypothetical protein
MPSTQTAVSDSPSIAFELLFYAVSLVLIGAVVPLVTTWTALSTPVGFAFVALGSFLGVVGIWSDGVTRVRGRSPPSRERLVTLFVASLLGQVFLQVVPVPTLGAIFGFLGALGTIRLLQVVTGQYP